MAHIVYMVKRLRNWGSGGLGVWGVWFWGVTVGAAIATTHRR